ncbi:sigma-70 family RNA polymerase sigma factor [Rubinisphaera sp. JC750]|uniref:sigma-70 family RNA polymerase sigma factor n=1 Tax=Rubinisphaera sp. JC750 TaxID=2898658 RepID=UPI001F026854|nr:sigma-70 family RNA polymerase sigma factor [Rubinisphaera sp. JC750]
MNTPSQNDSEANFVAELTACQLPLTLYIRSLLPGDPAAGDVAQQANARIWEKRGDFELGTNFKAWAFAIARFEVLNYRKQQARDARLVFGPDLEQTIANEIEQKTFLEERQEALRACMKDLRPRDRELLTQRYANSATLEDYAQEVGRSVNGLKVTLHRLRSALLECMKRRLRNWGTV